MFRTPSSGSLAFGLLLSAAQLAGCVPSADSAEDEDVGAVSQGVDPTCAEAASFTFSRDEAKGLTIASLDGEQVAWFTDGAFTVSMEGAHRSFSWDGPNHDVLVEHDTWVRTLPRPYAYTGASAYSEAELSDWLNAARAVNCEDPDAGEPDILALAYQYDEGSPDVVEGGVTIAGDADYQLGADFHDFMGTSWDPPDGSVRQPDPTMLGELDCSGFMRMIWGYRNNFPGQTYIARIPLSANALAGHLPRTAAKMYTDGTGKIIIADRPGRPTETELLQLHIGDIVFFDTDGNPADGQDHLGMYVGTSQYTKNGVKVDHHRFISSRDSLSGPTMGDGSAWSIFNSNSKSNYYSDRFRAARRF